MPAPTDLYDEALRLVDVARIHRDTMLRELGDPDVKRQRGNAGRLEHVEGTVAGIAMAFRAFGLEGEADRLEHALNEYDSSAVADGPSRARVALLAQANDPRTNYGAW